MSDGKLASHPGSAASVGSPSSVHDAAGAGIDSVVCFALAGAGYALDVAVVREVVPVDRLLAIPRAPAPIIGAFALRGATVALVDSRILFGLDAGGAHTTALIIARGHRTLCALTVDGAVGVVRFAEASFTPALRGREPPQVAGFISDERGGLITVLDTRIIVHSLERLRF
jgi:chemotaxis signal transduction protein